MFVQYCLLIFNKDISVCLWLNVFSYCLQEANFFRGYFERHLHETNLQKHWGLIGTFILSICTNVSLWGYFVLSNSSAAFLAYIFPIEF